VCSAPAPSLRSVLCVNRRHILYLIPSIPLPTDFKKSLAYSALRNGLYFQARTCTWSDNTYTGRCLLCLSLDKPCFPGRRLIHWRQWYLLKAWQSGLDVQLIYELVTFWKCVICCRMRLTFFCHTADSVCDLSGMISSFLICSNSWRQFNKDLLWYLCSQCRCPHLKSE
jgi:hypothetical protein